MQGRAVAKPRRPPAQNKHVQNNYAVVTAFRRRRPSQVPRPHFLLLQLRRKSRDPGTAVARLLLTPRPRWRGTTCAGRRLCWSATTTARGRGTQGAPLEAHAGAARPRRCRGASLRRIHSRRVRRGRISCRVTCGFQLHHRRCGGGLHHRHMALRSLGPTNQRRRRRRNVGKRASCTPTSPRRPLSKT